MKRVVVGGTIPPQWKGGRLARLCKGKGDAADSNSHRGLLIADHASKVFTSLLWPPVARVCDKRLPTEQCGCVRGRGTARVMHTSKLFARRAAAHKRPCALVFADLVKAFDRVLRAVVMGDSSINSEGSSGERVRERWIQAGVPAVVVNDAIAYVQTTGGVLNEADLHPGVLHLLRDLHDGTWFQLDGGHLIETNLGSRQGCKFGAIIFNLMYCRALDDLRCALRNEGLLSVFEYYPDVAPWCNMACKKDGTPHVASSYEMCDITYVDDECLCLDAGTNDELLEKLPKDLDIMKGVFTSHFLELNWKPLKTECVLHLIGRGTKHAWKTIERSAEQRAAAGPGAAKHVCRTPGGIECNVVPCYKHVGSLVDGLCRLECELQARCCCKWSVPTACQETHSQFSVLGGILFTHTVGDSKLLLAVTEFFGPITVHQVSPIYRCWVHSRGDVSDEGCHQESCQFHQDEEELFHFLVINLILFILEATQC